MPRLELTEPEAELLREIAGQALVTMRREIDHTDSRTYREELKWREAILEDLFERLGGTVTVPAG